jgi:hypothetical protein
LIALARGRHPVLAASTNIGAEHERLTVTKRNPGR